MTEAPFVLHHVSVIFVRLTSIEPTTAAIVPLPDRSYDENYYYDMDYKLPAKLAPFATPHSSLRPRTYRFQHFQPGLKHRLSGLLILPFLQPGIYD